MAGTGREALRVLSETRCDVVLSDIMMPDMDGIQLLRSVREQDLDVPVLLMTGSPSAETARQAREYGALGCLMKPLDATELQQAVDAALLLHRMAAKLSAVMFGPTFAEMRDPPRPPTPSRARSWRSSWRPTGSSG
jgi:DNA-binding NtrC family response regulator